MFTTLLAFQPMSMSPAQVAAVSYLARCTGHTHELYTYQLRRWFAWCESNGLDPLEGIEPAHVELYIRELTLSDGLVGEHDDARGLRGSSGSLTSTARSRQTQRSTRGCRRCIETSPALRVWTGSS